MWIGTKVLTPTIRSSSEGSSYRNLILNLKQVPRSCHVCSPDWLAHLSPYNARHLCLCTREVCNTFGFTPRMFAYFSMAFALSVTDGGRDCGCIRRALMGAGLQRNRKNESWTIQRCYGSFIWDPSGVQKASTELIHILSQAEQSREISKQQKQQIS